MFAPAVFDGLMQRCVFCAKLKRDRLLAIMLGLPAGAHRDKTGRVANNRLPKHNSGFLHLK